MLPLLYARTASYDTYNTSHGDVLSFDLVCFIWILDFVNVLRNTPTVPSIRVLLRMSVTLYSHHLPALSLLLPMFFGSLETAPMQLTRHDLRCTKNHTIIAPDTLPAYDTAV